VLQVFDALTVELVKNDIVKILRVSLYTWKDFLSPNVKRRKKRNVVIDFDRGLPRMNR
jgi:hypothetical protein